MIDMTFSPEMQTILKGMKGKVFKSYECDLNQRWHRTIAAFRINLGRKAVDVACVNRPVADWDVEYDEPTVFTCAESEPGNPFFPGEPSQVYMVDESIIAVEIVNDTVLVAGAPVASIDTALAIRTKFHTYTFARNEWFDYTIDVNVGDDAVVPYSAEMCAEDWSDEDEIAAVSRSTIAL